MSDNDDFGSLLRHQRTLTPEQRDALTRRVIARARVYRAETIRALVWSLFGWFRRRAAVARLRALDDRTLKDIGLDRSGIETAVRDRERELKRDQRVGRAA